MKRMIFFSLILLFFLMSLPKDKEEVEALTATEQNSYSFAKNDAMKVRMEFFKEFLRKNTEEELLRLESRLERERVYRYQLSLCRGAKKHPNHQAFVNALYGSLKGEVSRDSLSSILNDNRICYNPKVLRATLTWRQFRRSINEETSVLESRDFYLEHRELFDLTSGRYDVEPALIVSILKVETDLGRKISESPPVILTLYNLYFSRRAKSRIIERSRIFVTMMLELEWDPFVGGSREAAIGLPQFMLLEDSLHYSADGDGDGKIDLYNTADAIESVAKYLAMHGYGKHSVGRVLYSYNHSRSYVAIVLEHRALLESLGT